LTIDNKNYKLNEGTAFMWNKSRFSLVVSIRN